ncbi:MAG TPA: DUF4199 domain-containing protein [Pyrinomonadaceae bacterium]|nr:DUF4199 domain-containing protein [Pyrinomonadaceae bacterium]
MKKVVLTFGLIAGTIVAVLVWVIAWLCDINALSIDRAEIVGYASMLIALTMIFFGIKSYRDNYSGGAISFLKGVQIGLLISLIAGVMYFASGWLHHVVNPSFDDRFAAKYKQNTVEKMEAKGAAKEEIEKATTEIDQTMVMLQNPLIYFVVAMIEIMPVCIIVTLLSAALLRRKELLPALTEEQI